MRNLLRHIWHLPRNLIVTAISLYQHTLSPDHGWLRHFYPYGFCPQQPTCSDYGKQIVQQRGAIVGSLLIIKRVLSCHPSKKPSDETLLKLYAQTSTSLSRFSSDTLAKPVQKAIL